MIEGITGGVPCPPMLPLCDCCCCWCIWGLGGLVWGLGTISGYLAPPTRGGAGSTSSSATSISGVGSVDAADFARSANANPTTVAVGVEDDDPCCCWLTSDMLTASVGVFWRCEEVTDDAGEGVRDDCDNEGDGNGRCTGALSLDSKPGEGNISQMIRPTLTGSSSVPLTKLLLRRLCDRRRGLEFGDVEALASLVTLRALLVLEVVGKIGRFSARRDCEWVMGIEGSADADDDPVEGWGIDGARSPDDGARVGMIVSCSTWLASESVSIEVCDADGVKGCARFIRGTVLVEAKVGEPAITQSRVSTCFDSSIKDSRKTE